MAVIVIHAAAPLVLNLPIGTRSWWIANFFDSFARWAVPLFVMISGYLLLRDSGDLRVGSFYRKRFGKIVPALVFWIILYQAWFYLFLGNTFSWSEILKQLYAGNPYPGHLYFLFIILGLYIITPAVRRLFAAANSNVLVYSATLLLIASCIWFAIEFWVLRGGSPVNALTQWMPYLGYFIAGYTIVSLFSNFITIRRYLFDSLMFCGIILSVITYTFINIYGIPRGLFWYDFLSPIVMLFSLFVFSFIYSYKDSLKMNVGMRKLLYICGRLSFGVYLSHLFVLWAVSAITSATDLPPVLAMVVNIILTVILSYTLVLVLQKLPYIRSFVAA